MDIYIVRQYSLLLQVSVRSLEDAEQEEELFHVDGSEGAVSRNSWRREQIVVRQSRQWQQYAVIIR